MIVVIVLYISHRAPSRDQHSVAATLLQLRQNIGAIPKMRKKRKKKKVCSITHILPLPTITAVPTSPPTPQPSQPSPVQHALHPFYPNPPLQANLFLQNLSPPLHSTPLPHSYLCPYDEHNSPACANHRICLAQIRRKDAYHWRGAPLRRMAPDD